MPVLYKVDDARDSLGKATRDDLWQYAKAMGILPTMIEFMQTSEWHIERGWIGRVNLPATQANITKPDMEQFLRSRGHTNIVARQRIMGMPIDPEPVYAAPVPQPKPQAAPAAETKDPDKMSMNELRAECKARNIKMDRRDNLSSLRNKVKAAA